jgi:hypothetical protein
MVLILPPSGLERSQQESTSKLTLISSMSSHIVPPCAETREKSPVLNYTCNPTVYHTNAQLQPITHLSKLEYVRSWTLWSTSDPRLVLFLPYLPAPLPRLSLHRP